MTLTIKGIALEEKEILVYDQKFNTDDTINVCYKNKLAKISLKKFEEWRAKPRTSGVVMIYQKRKK
jgi:hypothetical protein